MWNLFLDALAFSRPVGIFSYWRSSTGVGHWVAIVFSDIIYPLPSFRLGGLHRTIGKQCLLRRWIMLVLVDEKWWKFHFRPVSKAYRGSAGLPMAPTFFVNSLIGVALCPYRGGVAFDKTGAFLLRMYDVVAMVYMVFGFLWRGASGCGNLYSYIVLFWKKIGQFFYLL